MMPRQLLRTLYRVFILGDTTTVRAIFAASSFFFGLLLVIYPDTLTRPYWRYMAFLPWWAWALAFWSHTAGVIWRFLDRPRMGWGFAVNAWGLFLWVFTTVLMDKASVEIAPSTAMEMTVIAAGFVCLWRTGLNDDAMSP